MHHRRDHGHFDVHQFEREAVLFENGLIGPALWAIELGDQRLTVFDTDLIHAVFVTVECQDAGIAEKTDAFDGIENQIGSKCCKRVSHDYSCAQQVAASDR